jgi:hypothetical protein
MFGPVALVGDLRFIRVPIGLIQKEALFQKSGCRLGRQT